MIASRLFHRVPREQIERDLSALGIRAGDSLLVVLSMRSVGFVVGGCESILGPLLAAVGPQGNLLLAASPALDPLPALPEGGLFDEAETPSACGLLSEAARRHPGALRSLHPSGSMVAIGPRAADWLRDHEAHPSPLEAGTPLDRFVAARGRILVVGASMGPILPYLQEKARYPLLFEEGLTEAVVRSRDGSSRRVQVRAYRSSTCQVVILQGERPESRDFVLMRDYVLVFPVDRGKLIERDGLLRQNRGRLLGRLERLKQRGIVATGRIGRAEAALIEAAPFCEQVGADLAWEVEKFREEYDPEKLRHLPLSAA